MSWDIVISNSSQKISTLESLDDTKLVPTSFCSVLERHFENITKDDDHREIQGGGFSIGYFCDDEPTTNILLNLYGETALYQLIDLAPKYNWQIFDTGIGEMIDLDNSSNNGYKNFQAYLTQISNNKNSS